MALEFLFCVDDCSRIPLLDPRIRRAPLAVALELHGPRAAADPWTVGRRSPLCETSELQDVLELRYLLAGCGQVGARLWALEANRGVRCLRATGNKAYFAGARNSRLP